jgi:MoxR-like ATPase
LSPRAGKALLNAAKAWAFMESRDYVIPEDIQAVFSAVCLHRIEVNLTDSYHNTSISAQNNIAVQILQQVDVLDPLGKH